MVRKRKSFDGVFKAKIALEVVKGERTIAEIGSRHEIHPNQVRQWHKKLLEEIPELFSRNRESHKVDQEELIDELYRQIGQLKVELEWLKKKSARLG